VVRTVLGKVKAAWLRFAMTIGRFNTRVVLTIVFATMFAVIHLALRLARRDPLHVRDDGSATRWVPIDQPSDEDPFVAHRRQF
jgi:hypothetical protein